MRLPIVDSSLAAATDAFWLSRCHAASFSEIALWGTVLPAEGTFISRGGLAGDEIVSNARHLAGDRHAAIREMPFDLSLCWKAPD